MNIRANLLNLFIESEDKKTVLSIFVTEGNNDQSRGEIIAEIIELYSYPLLDMTYNELAELKSVIAGRSN